MPVQDAPVQAFLWGHPLCRISGRLITYLHILVELDHALEGMLWQDGPLTPLELLVIGRWWVVLGVSLAVVAISGRDVAAPRNRTPTKARS